VSLDDQDFARICQVLGARPAASGLARLGITVQVEDQEEVERPPTLEAVRSLIGDCRRCGLCEGRKNIVFASGPDQAELMVVGEAPGQEEDARGRPFVGPSGQMLDRMLTAVLGLQRDQVYVLNCVKCRPPNNRDPLPAELQACLPFLAMQRDLVRPRVVLLMGTVAVQSCLRVPGGVKANRGRWHSWGGVPTTATFHPSYLLRRPEDKAKALEDLLLVKDLLERERAAGS
jgi:uracil-DNA glycosylase